MNEALHAIFVRDLKLALRAGGGAALAWLVRMAVVVPWKGGAPVTSSYNTTPRL